MAGMSFLSLIATGVTCMHAFEITCPHPQPEKHAGLPSHTHKRQGSWDASPAVLHMPQSWVHYHNAAWNNQTCVVILWMYM
jgi:hypothetical protein